MVRPLGEVSARGGRGGEDGVALSRRLSPAALYDALDSPADDAAAFLARLAGEDGGGVGGRPGGRAAPGGGEEAGVRPGRVLDVGCGTGRLFRPLAEAGWEVVGMEPDPDFRARAEEVARGLERVEVRAGGFEDVEGEEEYDLVVGLNSSFSHVLEPAARRDALVRCRLALRPGGRIVLDLPDLLRILWEYAGPSEVRCETDEGLEVALLRTHEVDPDRAVFTTHETYRVHDSGGREVQTETREHPYAIVSWPELAHALREAGFEGPRRRRAFTDPEPERAGRLIAVARRG